MSKEMRNSKFFKVLILVVVTLIPVIYSFFYLKSYWDPYGNLENLKVAIVNLDEGENGENRGEELESELKNSGVMDFVSINSSKEAETGLGNDEFYAVITIPSNFSKTLNSAGTENKQVSKIIYTPNKRKNYLASQILSSALKTVEINLQAKVSKEVTVNLADNLKEVPEKMEQIYDGAEQIDNGADSLKEGVGALNDGTHTLKDEYSTLDAGIASASEGSEKLYSGTSEVNGGLDQLADGTMTLNNALKSINAGTDELEKSGADGIEQLLKGISALDIGAEELKSGTEQYVDGVNSLGNGLLAYIDGANLINDNKNQILQGIIYYAKFNPNDETLQSLAAGATQVLDAETQNGINIASEQLKAGASQIMENGQSLKDGAEKLAEGTETLLSGSGKLSELSSGISTLKDALRKVEEGSLSLNTGVSSLRTGNTQVENGAKELSSGLETIKDGSSLVSDALTKLVDGTEQAYEGTVKLTDGTDTFKNQIQDGMNTTTEELKKLEGLNDYVENPVEFEEKSYGEVESYGIAFAPLFISIGLWVGALMSYVVLYYDQRHRFGILDHDSKKSKIAQNFIYLGIGAVEGIVTGLILKSGLGFEVESLGIYISECILVGVAFTAIIQFLIRNFGDIGKFIALILLILQLAASGGTFPVETIDNGFKIFTSWLPMTYTIRAFKDTLVSTNHSLLAGNNWILIGITVGLVIINLVIEIIKTKRTEESK